jgi:hypothetical protein
MLSAWRVTAMMPSARIAWSAASSGSRELSLVAALKQRPKAVTMERFLDGLAAAAGGAAPWLAAHGWTAVDHAAMRHKLLED